MKNKYKQLILISIIILTAFILGYLVKPSPQNTFIPIRETVSESTSEALPTKDSGQVKELLKQNNELKQRLKELKAKPKEVIYIKTHEEGHKEVLYNIPDSYQYITKQGLIVAQHTITNNNFQAITYDIDVQQTAILSETKNKQQVIHVETYLSTSALDKKIPFVSAVNVVVPKQRVRLELHPGIELEGSRSLRNKTYGLQAGAYISFKYGNILTKAEFLAASIEIKPAIKIGYEF